MLQIIKKYIILLNEKQKRRIIILVFLMLIGAVLETIGVSLIVPLMTAILNDNFYRTNQYAVMICRLLDIHSSKGFMASMLVAVALIFVIKDSFLLFEYYVQARFVSNNRLRMQQEVMQKIISRPYSFFLNTGSGEVLRRVTDDVSLTFNLLALLLNFYTEMIVSIVVVIAIMVIDPAMACVIMAVLVVELLIIYKVIKPVLRKAGVTRLNATVEANKWILQATSGIKELKVARKEEYFVKQFAYYAKQSVKAEQKKTVLDNAPRLIIEAVTVDVMIAFILILLLRGADAKSLLPQLSAFAFAAVRLLPAANHMSSAMNNIVYFEPALNSLLESFQMLENSDRKDREQSNFEQDDITFMNNIEIENISFAYPDSDMSVLDHANMIIPVGKSIGIVGTSGAGKTTVVDIILGLLKPHSGEVLSDGKNIMSNYDEWLSKVGYIPQMIYMLDDTIRANVAFGIAENEIDDEQIWYALEEAQLKEFVQSLPNGIDTAIGERGVRLSGGQRQRIGIARALYMNPTLLILDEATSALDNETEAAIMESIHALHGKKTLVIIAHRLTTIADCDIVYRVEDGKIVQER